MERKLEKAINGVFAKTFRSKIQQVDLTNAIKYELDTKSLVETKDRILAPNAFILRIAPKDFQHFSEIGRPLITELITVINAHARTQNYQFSGPVTIEFHEDSSIAQGIVHVDSQITNEGVTWKPVLDINGKKYPMIKDKVVIGRSNEADVTLPDEKVSRRHAVITWNGKVLQVEDLGSTNGSLLDNTRITKAVFTPESTLFIGNTRIRASILPINGKNAPEQNSDQFWRTS